MARYRKNSPLVLDTMARMKTAETYEDRLRVMYGCVVKMRKENRQRCETYEEFLKTVDIIPSTNIAGAWKRQVG